MFNTKIRIHLDREGVPDGPYPLAKATLFRRAIERFHDFAHSIQENLAVVNVAVASLEDIDGAILDLEVLYVDGSDEEYRRPDKEAQLKLLKKMKPDLEAEHKYGFPLLYGMTTVAVWSELEAYVEDLAASVLKHSPKIWEREPLSKIKAPVVAFMNLDRTAQCEQFVKLLQRDLSGGPAYGVSGHEDLWKALGYSKAVPKETRDVLVEMAAVRNVLVHRTGVADDDFRKRCPGFPLTKGTHVLVTNELCVKYVEAAVTYAGFVAARIAMPGAVKASLSADLSVHLDAIRAMKRPKRRMRKARNKKPGHQ